jgi:hypothetical protein
MADSIDVKASRIPDRDRLLRELRKAGLSAKAVGEVEIAVRVEGDTAKLAEEIYAQVERMIMAVGATFVPIKHEGVIYVRPPVG